MVDGSPIISSMATRHILKNISECTIEIVIPAWATTVGSDMQILIERSRSFDLSRVVSPEFRDMPRIRNLVARGLLQEVFE